MNILYLIGNGFDLNLGLETKYSDFYEYYKKMESNDERITAAKKSISDNYKNWSDLELALGQYTQELKNVDDFDTVFEDIGLELSKYLENEENKFIYDKIDSDKIYDHLVEPEKFLPPKDKNTITNYKGMKYGESWNIDIYTFNYTRIFENLIYKSDNHPISLGSKGNNKVILHPINHIHGYTDNRMVMGVNDVSQIKNLKFRENQDIYEALVKKECNKAYRDNIDVKFDEAITNSHLIVIFGSSIGDTDKIWWEQIGYRLRHDIRLIIFTKGEEVISPRIAYK